MDNELLLVIFRTILVLVILFILTKFMGKKQVSQMNIYDYLVGITIGSIAADIALDIDKDLMAGVVSLVIFGLSGVLVTYLTLKSISFRRIFSGVPTVLIDKGKILSNNLKKEGIDINDLQEEARQNGYFDLSKVNYAVLETNGNISFLAKADEEMVTRKDMKIKAQDGGLCANIIIDGMLLENNLENMKKDKGWLDKELSKRGYKDYSNILLLTLDNSGKVVVFDKNIDIDTKVLE
ncbi:MAG: DUF421 domain-containing protein [Bacilli bacterium]|nr:DUF421 domain-containing protein [Bacilli bacterium]